MKRLLALALACVAAGIAIAAPDEAELGVRTGYAAGPASGLAAHLVGAHRPENLVASFGGALEQALPHRVVKRGDAVFELKAHPQPWDIHYEHEGERRSLDDYLNRQRVTGLLVIKDGAILAERYQYGRGAATRFLSASMAKSVVGLLVGIALGEGRLRSLDDLAKVYAPGLAGSAYGETSVRDLLTMSSGVRFAERYDAQDDLDRLIRNTLEQGSAGGAAVLADYKERRVAPGTVFLYSSADTQALGLVLSGATGMSLADYMSSRLWAPMGAAEDASFQIDAAGQEIAFAFLHATLRDFGRLGVLAAQDGKMNGRQIVPAAWLRESTSTRAPHLQPFVASSYFGYGNHFWTFPGKHRRFAFIGVRGQVIFVDPQLNLVLVQTAVWKSAGDRIARAELLALWRGIVEHYGEW
jgi:CubicO group peptidase (beta-lactamase class C family)